MGNITVVGLGASSIDQLPLGIYRKLTQHEGTIYTRTKEHPVVQVLENEGVQFESMDNVYESFDQFEQVYEAISNQLIQKSLIEDVLYTVPGHPMVAERTVKILRNNEEVQVDVIGGQSFIDALFSAVKVDPIEGFQLLDGTDLRRELIQYRQHIFIAQVYDEVAASEVKLTLMEDLPYDYPITIVDSAGDIENEKVNTVPLYQLDRQFQFSNLTTLYIKPADSSLLHHQFDAIREVVARLRGPGGCPWDQKQTHESLRRFLIEEAYEVIDAIEEEDDDHIAEELGDVLLQVMLHSQIAEESGYFTVNDVIRSITDKMIERHPHVFGEVSVNSAEEVKKNWEQIKQKNRPKTESVLDELNESLPRLLFAKEIQKKVSKVGFDWNEPTSMFSKVEEEIKELQEALSNESTSDAEMEFGDVLFSLVNVGRYYQLDPELALHRTSVKFIKRFKKLEEMLKHDQINIDDASLELMDHYWEKAKQTENE